MEDKLENQYFASLYANEKAFIVQTKSGFRLLMLDTLFPPHILPPNVDDNLLGQAISQALKNSRTFKYGSEECKNFFDPVQRVQRYNQWVDHIRETLGYKTKSAFFRRMMMCGITMNSKEIIISPNKHIRSDAWEGIDEKDIIMPADSNYVEIGQGAKQALSYCK